MQGEDAGFSFLFTMAVIVIKKSPRRTPVSLIKLVAIFPTKFLFQTLRYGACPSVKLDELRSGAHGNVTGRVRPRPGPAQRADTRAEGLLNRIRGFGNPCGRPWGRIPALMVARPIDRVLQQGQAGPAGDSPSTRVAQPFDRFQQ